MLPELHVSDRGRVVVSLVVSLMPHPGSTGAGNGATGSSLRLWSWHHVLTPGMGSCIPAQTRW